MAASKFTLYVLPVKGKPVTRYGSKIIIGGHRSPEAPSVIVWDTKTIVQLPPAEYLRYRREYDRALQSGSLKKTTAAKWKQQQTEAVAPAPTTKDTSK